MKTLLQGKPYVSAAATDIRKTFARIRREMKERQQRQADADKELESKLRHIERKAAA